MPDGFTNAVPPEEGFLGNRRTAAGALTAGAINFTVPTNARWKIHMVKLTYTASGTAGTRQVRVQFDDGTNIFFKVPQAGPIVSQIYGVYLSPDWGGLDSSTALWLDNVSYRGWCPRWLFQGWRIRVSDNAAIDNADTVAIEAIVDEYIEPNQ